MPRAVGADSHRAPRAAALEGDIIPHIGKAIHAAVIPNAPRLSGLLTAPLATALPALSGCTGTGALIKRVPKITAAISTPAQHLHLLCHDFSGIALDEIGRAHV